jgi:hypothetical protein
MKAGDTFLTPNMDDHLWMVISNPALDPVNVVVVCFLPWQNHYDQSCIVEAAEHPFVTHSTCVNYPGATIVADATLETLRVRGALREKEPLSSELFNRIRRSAENADVPTECYAVLRSQGFVG